VEGNGEAGHWPAVDNLEVRQCMVVNTNQLKSCDTK